MLVGVSNVYYLTLSQVLLSVNYVCGIVRGIVIPSIDRSSKTRNAASNKGNVYMNSGT